MDLRRMRIEVLIIIILITRFYIPGNPRLCYFGYERLRFGGIAAHWNGSSRFSKFCSDFIMFFQDKVSLTLDTPKESNSNYYRHLLRVGRLGHQTTIKSGLSFFCFPIQCFLNSSSMPPPATTTRVLTIMVNDLDF